MSVYTSLNQNQLAALLENYAIDGMKESSEISDGIENSNYLVTTESGDFVLTIFEQEHPQLEQVFVFMVRASNQGLALPRPVENRQGELLSSFEHEGNIRKFVLCEKLPGRHPETIGTDLCKVLGQTFAQIHQLRENEALLEHFSFRPLSFFIPEKVLDFDDENKRALYESSLENLKQLEKQIEKLLEKQGDELPKGLCHCDFFPDNSLVSENGNEKITGLLDWYDMQHSYLLLDLAIIAVSWCKDEQGMNDEKVDALLSAYQQVRKLEKKEIELWGEFLKAAALIFWVSREVYVKRMKDEGRGVLAHKNPEEFYQLLGQLYRD